jgi:osmoprotectant transport system permease protein
LNADAERTKNYTRAADLYFNDGAGSAAPTATEPLTSKLVRWISRHLQLTGVSLLLAVLVGIPLGIVASRGGAIGHVILAVISAVQTIPSLALLALLVPVPFFGISARTAIAALFLYGLLPSSATPRPACRTSRSRSANPPSRSASRQSHGCAKSTYRWPRARFSPA